MSVLIEGMEMPKGLAERGFVIRGDGRVRTFNGAVIDYATAIPVPNHGRLVDETDLIPDGGYIIADGMVCVPVKCINDAPTVIPEDKEAMK